MDGSLLGFQAAEILDSTWLVMCILLLLVGIGLWTHATYFRKDDK